MALFDIDEVLGSLQAVRRRWRDEQKRAIEPGGRDLPSRDALSEVITTLKGVLFPMRLGPTDLRQDSENFYVAHALDAALHALLAQAKLELLYVARRETGDGEAAPQRDFLRGAPHGDFLSVVPHGDFLPVVPHGDSLTVVPHGDSLTVVDARAIEAVQAFAQRLPEIRALLDTDVIAAYHGDPAAGSVDEVLLCYPGVLAMIHHRLAHELYRLGLPLLARIVAELAHAETGIDIHPGARIGAGFFIDHGTGVVIGETAIIGERVRLYQAVTLGAKRFPRNADGHLEKGLARHPIVEDDVVVYAGATILGRVTIGRGATIGGNVWITHDVAPGSHVTQASLRNESARSPDIAVGLTIGAHG
ncbi:serine acetyltransferase [Trinickia symbiotica]|uniref:serine O-acetyltransferase n=1 Tax=Trinickia symbiotica TaxID=863227 RepID=A0A2T3XZ90_9BURK|nr:serine O-acetyltransferase EpsC [Trinickia symbiotica]PTB21840.1 serine acetyltransferase [Trinickia symbiotica]